MDTTKKVPAEKIIRIGSAKGNNNRTVNMENKI
jgi:hypothetical protein